MIPAMIILETIFPLFALIFLGILLKHCHLTDESFLKKADTLIYYIFFPLMLFWKIGQPSHSEDASISLCLSALMAVSLVFSASLVFIKKTNLPACQVGSFSQACYRFNTYIGMALVMEILGGAGVRQFGILVSVVIPFINILAVSILIWHGGQQTAIFRKGLYLVWALVSNPLILGCLAGFLFSRSGFVFPEFINRTFSLMTSVTLPLALISIGGSLRFKGVVCHTRMSLAAAGFKLVLLPVAGFSFLTLFQVTGVAFKTGMIFFCLPTSTAIYLLSAQLNSDTELASAAIMVSTLLSAVSLSAVLFLI